MFTTELLHIVQLCGIILFTREGAVSYAGNGVPAAAVQCIKDQKLSFLVLLIQICADPFCTRSILFEVEGYSELHWVVNINVCWGTSDP